MAKRNLPKRNRQGKESNLPVGVPKKIPDGPQSPQHPTSAQDTSGTIRLEREFYSGPIPHAAELERYDRIEKGLAGRIVGMAERALDGQITTQHKVIDGSISLQRWTLVIGGLMALCALVFGYLLIRDDKSGEGFALIIGAIASLLAAFLYGKHIEGKQTKEETDEEQSEED